MFCRQCGAYNRDVARFCVKCGSALAPEQETMPKAEETKMPKEEMNPAAPKAKRAGMHKALISAVVAVLVLALAAVAIFLFANRTPTIKLEKYVNFVAEGYDHYGTADASIDWDAIERDYGKKVAFKKENSDLAQPVLGDDPIYCLRWLVYLDPVSANTGVLANGETVPFSWYVDPNCEKYIDVKLEYPEVSYYTVTGLETADTFDAFADLTVEFLTVDGEGYVSLKYTGKELSLADFHTDSEWVSNGDVVVVNINTDLGKCADTYGKIPAELSRQYTVSGLPEYLTSVSQMDEAGLETMKQQAVNVFNSYFYGTAVKSGFRGHDTVAETELRSLTYLGNYFMTRKAGSPEGTSANELYLVYKYRVHSLVKPNLIGEQDYDQTDSFYWFIKYSNVIAEADGSLSPAFDPYQYVTPNERMMTGIDYYGYWYFNGYNTINEIFNGFIIPAADRYNYEINIDTNAAVIEGDNVFGAYGAGAAAEGTSGATSGQTFKLGKYEQDNDTNNGAEEIKWRVLAIQDGKALVISTKCLDSRVFSDGTTTWANSSLRKWLNGEFYNNAFSEEEKSLIRTNEDTEDEVFLLSSAEASKYFNNKADRTAEPTAYAEAQQRTAYKQAGKSYDPDAWWWLRDAGTNKKSAAGVYQNGTIDYEGGVVTHAYNLVRPAMWVDISVLGS